MLTDFAIWSLAVFGLSMILSISKIAKPFREFLFKKSLFLYDLIKCPMCNAFWIGVVYTIIWRGVTGCILMDGLVASGITLFLYCICWNLAIGDEDF